MTYGTGTAGQAAVGDYIIGQTSGAVGKVLSRTGNATSGTYTLTNVIGLFQNTEGIDVLSTLNFDTVTASNGGFKVGDTITGGSSASTIVVKAIEYNLGAVAGAGTIYGAPMSALFTNNEALNVGGTSRALADGVGVDNDSVNDSEVSGTLAVPGTTNTNNSVIIHYDAGTIAIPEGAKIAETGSGAVGFAQQVYGVTATGSIRVVDSDSTVNDWSDNVSLEIRQVVF